VSGDFEMPSAQSDPGGSGAYETISLDFGGTIGHETTETAAVYREVLSKSRHAIELEKLRTATKAALEQVAQENRKNGRIWTNQSIVEQAQRVLQELKIPNDDLLAREMAELHPHGLNYRPYDDVEPALKEIKRRGLKLIIVSNVSSLQNLLTYLGQTGLTRYFDALVASGTIGFEKPDSRIFAIASERSGTPPERMVHVGDSYPNDYVGAESAGLTGVLLDRKGRHTEAKCRRISKLTELLQMLSSA